METQRTDFIVIMAGYPKEMQKLLDANPGLQYDTYQRFHWPRLDHEFHSASFSKITQNLNSLKSQKRCSKKNITRWPRMPSLGKYLVLSCSMLLDFQLSLAPWTQVEMHALHEIW